MNSFSLVGVCGRWEACYGLFEQYRSGQWSGVSNLVYGAGTNDTCLKETDYRSIPFRHVAPRFSPGTHIRIGGRVSIIYARHFIAAMSS